MVRRADNFDDRDANDFYDFYQPTKKKRPERGEFLGLWLPVEICDLVEDGTLSPTEAFLLATINRFVSARGEGCWVTNERLGRLLGGLSERRVRAIISKLINQGLVFRVSSEEHERLLETCFSRIHKKKTGGRKRPRGMA